MSDPGLVFDGDDAEGGLVGIDGAEVGEAIAAGAALGLLAFAGAVFLLYALFDLLPKMLFRMFPNRLCIGLARPFGFMHSLLKPLVGLVGAVTHWIFLRDDIAKWRKLAKQLDMKLE